MQDDYKTFKNTINDPPNKHPPLKRKYLRANNLNFIMKVLKLII